MVSPHFSIPGCLQSLSSHGPPNSGVPSCFNVEWMSSFLSIKTQIHINKQNIAQKLPPTQHFFMQWRSYQPSWNFTKRSCNRDLNINRLPCLPKESHPYLELLPGSISPMLTASSLLPLTLRLLLSLSLPYLLPIRTPRIFQMTHPVLWWPILQLLTPTSRPGLLNESRQSAHEVTSHLTEAFIFRQWWCQMIIIFWYKW